MTSRFEPEDPGSNLRSANPPMASAAGSVGSSSQKTFSVSHPRFEVDPSNATSKRSNVHPIVEEAIPLAAQDDKASATDSEANDDSSVHDNLWRQEVAAKLNRYRARKRVATPRYPSLQLKFDDSTWNRPSSPPEVPPSRLAVAMQPVPPEPPIGEVSSVETVEEPAPLDTGAKIIEFPRFFATPQITFDELADPVVDRPRILEVPEQLPPPPALGGILIEPQEQSPAERRPGFELPLNPPAMSRRITAGIVDGAIVLSAFAGFAFIAFKIAASLPPLKEGLAVSAGLTACFWAAYQYVFLVYSGSTPGLKLAKLSLNQFSGEPVPRRLRRWRVLASMLSGLSLGLGYAWCWLDEDQLCWHDRITRTYMAKIVPLNASAAKNQ